MVTALTSLGIWSSHCQRGCAGSVVGRSWHLGNKTPCKHPLWSQQAGCSGQAKRTPEMNEWLQPTVPSYILPLVGQLLKFVLVWVFGEGFSCVYLWNRAVKFLDASHEWNNFTTQNNSVLHTKPRAKPLFVTPALTQQCSLVPVDFQIQNR